MEEFKVLHRFLYNALVELQQELQTIEVKGEIGELVRINGVIKQINLLGSLYQLPEIIKNIKEADQKLEELKTQAKASVHDPLADLDN